MRFARWVYGISGVYGLLVLVPGLFLASHVDAPPLNHPEFYFGFYGCGIAWQIAFLLIARDPVRWSALMPVTFVEKASFFGACLWLYHTHQLAIGGPFYGSLLDGVWLVLFVIAWLRTPKTA
jgi:hypothetical protein